MTDRPESEGPIRDVSDTALWVAMYRAEESERKDAIFRDPYARRLAGEHGQRILDSIPRGHRMSWPLIVRTQILDTWVLERTREGGADTVLDLAAGLDARPWRLPLPADLHWVDVDLPGMLAHKQRGMAGETPRCRYTAHAADLRDPLALHATLERFAPPARRVLVITEGLLVYLEPDQVATLARELAGQAGCRWWIMDLSSPMLLEWMAKRWKGPRGLANAPFRFAPPEGAAFFAPFGWREREYRSLFTEAQRLKRVQRSAWIWALFVPFMSRGRRGQMKRFSGCVQLERVDARG
jgi:methyltransferase (TIGR00027 family)